MEKFWSPEGYSWYGGELISNKRSPLTPEEQLEILDTHPFFTGVCPQCGYQFAKNNPPKVHWDCPACGWMDDSVH
jgi:rubrerythrin